MILKQIIFQHAVKSYVKSYMISKPSKLRGLKFIEMSPKGIPHGIVHYPEMAKWAGHLSMFDTCAPEASHKETIKAPMDRVRKSDERSTATSMMDWTLRTRTWSKIVASINSLYRPPKDNKKATPTSLSIKFSNRCMHRPVGNVRSRLTSDTFSPLREGGDNLLTSDVRVRSHMVSSYVVSYMVSHMIAHMINHI